MLIAFGGLTANVAEAVPPKRLESPELRWQMQNIAVYDIANERWYQQQAHGDIPSWRSAGCAIAVSAMDNSSHSVYVFGGWGSSNTQNNDGNVYVLSIPSFTWIRVTLDTDQRSQHKCHLMGKHHMLVVGGIRPNREEQYPSGMAGCDTDPKFNQGLGMFSLNNHTWATNYDPEVGAAPYQVHSSITNAIGGNATGGATKRTPDAGFSSDDLRKLMSSNQQNPDASMTNTTAPEPPSAPQKPKSSLPLSKGAIAGTVVGVTISALIIAIVLYLIHHHRRSHRKESTPTDRSISRPLQPVLLNEIYAGPAGHELRSGTFEDNLAKMYQGHEAPNTAEIHEMPIPSMSHELPALQGSQAAKIPPPDTLHPALVDGNRGDGRGIRHQTRTANKQ